MHEYIYTYYFDEGKLLRLIHFHCSSLNSLINIPIPDEISSWTILLIQSELPAIVGRNFPVDTVVTLLSILPITNEWTFSHFQIFFLNDERVITRVN